jgi:pfkB family carbohydrate kinase
VLLDAGGADAPLPDALLRHISILSPNETELSRLTGLPTEGDVQLLAAAQVLCERADAAQHSEEQQQQQQQQPARLQVLLKLGAQGSMLLGADDAPQSNVLRQQAVPPPAVVDTTGEEGDGGMQRRQLSHMPLPLLPLLLLFLLLLLLLPPTTTLLLLLLPQVQATALLLRLLLGCCGAWAALRQCALPPQPRQSASRGRGPCPASRASKRCRLCCEGWDAMTRTHSAARMRRIGFRV